MKWSELPRHPLSKKAAYLGGGISLVLYLIGFYLSGRLQSADGGAAQLSLVNGLFTAGAVVLAATVIALLALDFRQNRAWYREKFKR